MASAPQTTKVNRAIFKEMMTDKTRANSPSPKTHCAPRNSDPVWTADRLLVELGAELAECERVELEFSLRLRPGEVETQGRFGCWIEGEEAVEFAPIAHLLDRLNAPFSVREAQRDASFPVRQGIAVAFRHDGRHDRHDETDAGPEFRLYLHNRDPNTAANRYHAWHWTPGQPARSSTYTFYFWPETPSGQRPLDLVPLRLRPVFTALLADERLQQISGFWLRTNEEGETDQLCLAFPWQPQAQTLPGLLELAAWFHLPSEELSALPIRHVAVNLRSETITLYASASLQRPWPSSEHALQQQVRHTARAFHESVETHFYQRLPKLPPPSLMTVEPELGRFYDGHIPTWKAILGSELHYHAGLFDPESTPNDEAMNVALRRAVTDLSPFLPRRGRIYDIGCGWGGPLAIWMRDVGCHGLGLTNSRAQFQYVSALGLPVRWGDAERTLPPGHFDCAILLESFSHIQEKARLLRVLRFFAHRLVMRVNCQDASPPGTAFGNTMHMIDSTQLRELLEDNGWRIQHWRNRRQEALPSVSVWHRRLQALPTTEDLHVETLRHWCARVMIAPNAWAECNPLIEVVAD